MSPQTKEISLAFYARHLALIGKQNGTATAFSRSIPATSVCVRACACAWVSLTLHRPCCLVCCVCVFCVKRESHPTKKESAMIDPSKDKFAYFKDNIQTAEDKVRSIYSL